MSHRNTVEYLESKYILPEPNSGCLIWTGHVNSWHPKRMYGRTKWYNKKLKISEFKLTHVLFYELKNGPVPRGKVLDHLCRVTLCCNPDHLEPVTQLENMERGIQRTKTHCDHGHPYTDGWEWYYRKDNEGIRYRRCLTCYSLKYPGTAKSGVPSE